MAINEIPFTQFLRSDGRQIEVSIVRPRTVMDKAEKIIAAGYRFECEELTTGHFSFTVTDDEGDHAIEVCMNGPEVPAAVDRLIANFDPARTGAQS